MSKARSRRMVAIKGCSWVLGFAFGFIGTLAKGGSSLPFWCTRYLKSFLKGMKNFNLRVFHDRLD